MKVKRFFIFIALVAEYLAANAQYTFQVITAVSNGKPQISTWWPSYSTRELCEQRRREVERNLTFSSYLNLGEGRGARIILKTTTTPCTGPGGGAIGSVDLLGVDRGGSFFSTNPANEIRDWSEDDMRRMTALGKDINSYEPQDLSTGDVTADLLRNQKRETATFNTSSSDGGINFDRPFVSLNLNPDGSYRWGASDLSTPKEIPSDWQQVDRCLNMIDVNDLIKFETAEECVQWVKEKYKEASGYDVDVLFSKMELSDAEKQAIANFRGVLEKVDSKIDDVISHSKETEVYEAAIFAEDCYGDSDRLKDFPHIHKFQSIEDIPNSEMRHFYDLLDRCNKTNSETGFHAELYLDEKTGKYFVAFEGSNMHFIKNYKDCKNDWLRTNFKSGSGDVPAQYVLAAFLGQNAPKGIDIVFTGHSLGGGEASLAAAVSGKQAYTFNAEGVSDMALAKYNVLNKKDEGFTNIIAYHTKTDLLTNTQNVIGKMTNDAIAPRALGIEVNLGDLTTTGQKVLAGGIETAGKMASPATTVGGALVGTAAGIYEGLSDGTAGAVEGAIKGWAVGTAAGYAVGQNAGKITLGGLAHRMTPMVGRLEKERATFVNKMSENKNAFNREHYRASTRSQQTVQIIIE